MTAFIVYGAQLHAVPRRVDAYTRTPVSIIVEERTPRAAMTVAKYRWAGQSVEIVGIGEVK